MNGEGIVSHVKMGRRAATDTTVCPDLVDVETYGHHASRVVDGRREWQFETKESCDRFVTDASAGKFARRNR